MTLTGRAYEQLCKFRARFLELKGADAIRAVRSVPYALQYSAEASVEMAEGWAEGRSLFAFVWNQLVCCMRFGADGKTTRVYVKQLSPENCAEQFRLMMKRSAASVQTQLSQLVKKKNLKELLEREIQQREKEIDERRSKKQDDLCRGPTKRILHLRKLIAIVNSGGLSSHFKSG
jgi:hypothetical protein